MKQFQQFPDDISKTSVTDLCLGGPQELNNLLIKYG